MKLKIGVTFQQVKESPRKTIYYSSRSPWWTDDPEDIKLADPRPEYPEYRLPVDILGAPLFEASKEDFLEHVEKNPFHYGEHGIETLWPCITRISSWRLTKIDGGWGTIGISSKLLFTILNL